MGYPVNLDEYEEWQLEAEIDRRRKLRAKGLCDYCERSIGAGSRPCKMTDRHAGDVIPLAVRSGEASAGACDDAES